MCLCMRKREREREIWRQTEKKKRQTGGETSKVRVGMKVKL